MSFLLTPAQITDLENRNPEIGDMISTAITTGSIDLHMTGYSFTDSVYGNVLISLDANGNIQVNAQSPINPTVANAPPPGAAGGYTPPAGPGAPPVCPGWSNIGSFTDFLACLETGAQWALLGLVAVVGYVIYKEVK